MEALQGACSRRCKQAAMLLKETEGMTETAIDRFCSAIAAADLGKADVFCQDVVLDATVPNWRFVRRGQGAVRAELSGWFVDPGRFDTLRRTPLPDGELVEFDLAWKEGGV